MVGRGRSSTFIKEDQTVTDHSEESGLFPPLPEELESLLENMPESAGPDELYRFLLESQCGATDDSQPVEQYDGTLGVTLAAWIVDPCDTATQKKRPLARPFL